MIVADHSGLYPNCYSEVKGVKRAVFDDTYYYVLGFDPPHYPVPAIQRIIDITPYEVVAWISVAQETWPDQDYRTMYVEHQY